MESYNIFTAVVGIVNAGCYAIYWWTHLKRLYTSKCLRQKDTIINVHGFESKVGGRVELMNQTLFAVRSA